MATVKSPRKRIIQELSVEELLELATSSNEDVVMDKITDAAKFIYELGIKPGDHKISAQIIYYHYKKWKGRFNTAQPRTYFFRDFSKYFQRVSDTHGSHYLLDPKPFDLSKETWWLMRKQLRRERALQRGRRQNGNKKEDNEA